MLGPVGPIPLCEHEVQSRVLGAIAQRQNGVPNCVGCCLGPKPPRGKVVRPVPEPRLPQSRIRQHLKDVELMLASAAQAGQPLPLSEAHATLMRDAIAAGDGDLDNAGLIQQFRRQRRPGN